MKRIITVLFAAILMLSMAACGGNGNTPNGGDSTTPSSTPAQQEATTTPETTPEQVQGEAKELKLGETVTTDNFEFVLTRVEFAERVTNAGVTPGEGVKNQSYLLPTPIQDEKSPHRAFDGFIYVSYSYNLKYLGETEMFFDAQLLTELFYNDKYLFAANGSLDGNYSYDGWSTTYSLENGNWSSTTDIQLSPFGRNNEFEVRAYVRVPIELVENSDAPLNMIFRLDGNEFMYPISTEQRSTYIETKASAIKEIDEQLQGTWVQEETVEGLTVSYAFADGRFTYIYDYKDDAYDSEKEGSYAIEEKTITLIYDELDSTTTLNCSLMDGAIILTGYTSSNLKVEYIKQK